MVKKKEEKKIKQSFVLCQKEKEKSAIAGFF